MGHKFKGTFLFLSTVAMTDELRRRFEAGGDTVQIFIFLYCYLFDLGMCGGDTQMQFN